MRKHHRCGIVSAETWVILPINPICFPTKASLSPQRHLLSSPQLHPQLVVLRRPTTDVRVPWGDPGERPARQALGAVADCRANPGLRLRRPKSPKPVVFARVWIKEARDLVARHFVLTGVMASDPLVSVRLAPGGQPRKTGNYIACLEADWNVFLTVRCMSCTGTTA